MKKAPQSTTFGTGTIYRKYFDIIIPLSLKLSKICFYFINTAHQLAKEICMS